MEQNLKSTTFNKHSKPYNNLINKRSNPYVNKISNDITYKSKSIHPIRRNPEHIKGGDEYLYTTRINIIRRQLQTGKITKEQYENQLKQIQIARYGEPLKSNNTSIKQSQQLTLIKDEDIVPKSNNDK